MPSLRRLAIVLLCGSVLLPLPLQAQSLKLPLRLSAFAVSMANIATGANARVELVINRWSTEAERQKLITTFQEKGPDKLLDALQDTKAVGYLKLPNRLGYDLRFARQTALDDGGTRIVLVTDRPIGQEEARSMARTMDYPFTLVEIHLKKDGTGEGKLSVATKIELNKKDNSVVLENWDTEPVRLNAVKIDK
ncbi:MAG: hypothetical protein ACHQO8_07110 [Vicinamibacterales bacterium]